MKDRMRFSPLPSLPPSHHLALSILFSTVVSGPAHFTGGRLLPPGVPGYAYPSDLVRGTNARVKNPSRHSGLMTRGDQSRQCSCSGGGCDLTALQGPWGRERRGLRLGEEEWGLLAPRKERLRRLRSERLDSRALTRNYCAHLTVFPNKLLL